MKNFIYGIAITGSILGTMEAIASEVPSTKWNPAMDSVFVPVSEGIAKDAVNTNLKLEGKRIAFKNSFMTGTIDGETVFRVQPKEGMRNEEGDTGDSTAAKHSRSEWGTTQKQMWKFGDTSVIKYSFYVPAEVELAGHSKMLFGQAHGIHTDHHIWAISTTPSEEVVFTTKNGKKIPIIQFHPTSKFSKTKAVRAQDLTLSLRGALDAQGLPKFETFIQLEKAGKWQGKWNDVEIYTTYGVGKEGAFKVVFNGKTVVDCTCDMSQEHEEYTSEVADIAAQKPGFTFNFGVHRYLFLNGRWGDAEVVDPVVYYKDVTILKN